MVPGTKPETNMILANANIEEIRARMGADATIENARRMVEILDQAGITDTDQVADADWFRLVGIATQPPGVRHTGNYEPSGFAIAARRGLFASGSMEVEVHDGGAAPTVGSLAVLFRWPGDPHAVDGAVVAVETHCNGRVTVTCEFPR